MACFAWRLSTMPIQADLLELIAARETWDDETIRRACLDLSAWGRLEPKRIGHR